MKFKNIDVKSVVGIAICLGSAIAAFMTEKDNQQKEKTLKDLVERVSNLEKKG